MALGNCSPAEYSRMVLEKMAAATRSASVLSRSKRAPNWTAGSGSLAGGMRESDNRVRPQAAGSTVVLRTATAQHATSVAIAQPSCDKHQDNRAPCGVQ